MVFSIDFELTDLQAEKTAFEEQEKKREEEVLSSFSIDIFVGNISLYFCASMTDFTVRPVVLYCERTCIHGHMEGSNLILFVDHSLKYKRILFKLALCLRPDVHACIHSHGRKYLILFGGHSLLYKKIVF